MHRVWSIINRVWRRNNRVLRRIDRVRRIVDSGHRRSRNIVSSLPCSFFGSTIPKYYLIWIHCWVIGFLELGFVKAELGIIEVIVDLGILDFGRFFFVFLKVNFKWE